MPDACSPGAGPLQADAIASSSLPARFSHGVEHRQHRNHHRQPPEHSYRIDLRDSLSHLSGAFGPVALLGLFIDWAILHWVHLRNGNGASDTPAAAETTANLEPEMHPAFPVNREPGRAGGILCGFPPALVAATGGAVLLMQRHHSPKAIYGDVDWSLLMLFLGLFLILGGAQEVGSRSNFWAQPSA